MTITIRRTRHLDESDLDRIDRRNEVMFALLSNKILMRASDNKEGEKQIEQAFMWLRDTCKHFYSVRGPEQDKDTVKYYIYFENEEEATLFVLSFPQE
jgi:anionic cell wall polymer biosynthesis LytR-Cps2A-Psr (LCP) family protein